MGYIFYKCIALSRFPTNFVQIISVMKRKKENVKGAGRKSFEDRGKIKISFWGTATKEDIELLKGKPAVAKIVSQYVKERASKVRRILAKT